MSTADVDVTFNDAPVRADARSRSVRLFWPGSVYHSLGIIFPTQQAAAIVAEAINAALKEAAQPQPETEAYPGRAWRYVAASPSDARNTSIALKA